MALETVLADKRDAIAKAWLVAALASCQGQSSAFLLQEEDAFRNPVGHTFKEGLRRLLDAVIAGAQVRDVEPTLDEIIRLRSVQAVSPGQAVAFLPDLKRILREHVSGHLRERAGCETLAAIEGRIDELTLAAVDLLVRCREQLAEIRLNEARRRLFVLERTRRGPAEPGDEDRRS